jgi:transposase
MNSFSTDHGGMTSHENTSRKHRIRGALRYIWQDTTNANRALFRLPPYDDYLQNNRRSDTYR